MRELSYRAELSRYLNQHFYLRNLKKSKVNMAHIDSYDFSGKRVLIRVDFNVPLNAALEVTDDTRIRAALPTLRKVIAGGGMPILMSHLGRPKNGPEDKFSLRHTVPTIEKLLNCKVKMASDCVGANVNQLSDELQAGEVLLLENLRFHKEETAGDEYFAGQLAENGDVYINDAFGTAHRAHASTAIIAKFFPTDKLFGYVMENEIKHIDKVLHHAEAPVTAIIGGAKVSSKITIIERLIPTVDHLLIGGGMAYTFVKAQGGQVGNSLVEEDKLDLAMHVLKLAKENNTQLHLPEDSVCANAFDNDADIATYDTASIPEGWMGMDIGPKSILAYEQVLEASKTILWNGPMGVFEMSNFAAGTASMAKKLAEITPKGVFTLVGGGDSVAAINQFELADQVSYVSTGGGAMLEYLEGKTLPGIAAIQGV